MSSDDFRFKQVQILDLIKKFSDQQLQSIFLRLKQMNTLKLNSNKKTKHKQVKDTSNQHCLSLFVTLSGIMVIYIVKISFIILTICHYQDCTKSSIICLIPPCSSVLNKLLNPESCNLLITILIGTVCVVYFDQCLGAANPKRWSKQSFSDKCP